MVHRYQMAKGITPHEMEGLVAVLKLTQIIAKWVSIDRVTPVRNGTGPNDTLISHGEGITPHEIE